MALAVGIRRDTSRRSRGAAKEHGPQSVSRYIEQQESHHRKKTFAEGYITFLEKNKIPYDPRYVFE